MEVQQNGESDLVFHIRGGASSGVLVGSDACWSTAAQALSGISNVEASKREQQEEQAQEALRALYRIAWNHAITRTCLAKNGAQIMCGAVVMPAVERLKRVQQNNLIREEQEALAKCAAAVQDEYEASLWRMASVDCNTTGSDAAGETLHFHRVGQVGIFVLNCLDSSALKHLKDKLEVEEDLKVIIIASDRSTAYRYSVPHSSDETENLPQAEDVGKFLGMLFQWKESKPEAREALLLSGGTQIGMTSELRDSRSGLAIPEVIVSPTSGTVKAFEGPRAGDLSERFAFVHHPLEGQHVFCKVDVDLQTRSGRPSVDVHLMSVPIIRQGSGSPVKSKATKCY